MLKYLVLFLGLAGCLQARAPSDHHPLQFESFFQEPAYRLRLCNAYASILPLQIKLEAAVLAESLSYLDCREFTAQVALGQRLHFIERINETAVNAVELASFQIKALPKEDAVLLVVIHRQDANSTAPDFKSHIFANLKNSQVVFFDAYKTVAPAHTSTLRIQDHPDAKLSVVRQDFIPPNQAVAIKQGWYQLSLLEPTAEGQQLLSVVDRAELTALNGESYVVINAGVQVSVNGTTPDDFAEKLMVFPKPDKKALSPAARVNAGLALVAACLMAVFVN